MGWAGDGYLIRTVSDDAGDCGSDQVGAQAGFAGGPDHRNGVTDPIEKVLVHRAGAG
jgi:hypothetical protein